MSKSLKRFTWLAGGWGGGGVTLLLYTAINYLIYLEGLPIDNWLKPHIGKGAGMSY